MCGLTRFAFIYLCWWCMLHWVFGEDFCSENLFDHDNPNFRFTQELSSVEFGIGRHPKSLHCCADDYKSILWLKGDKAYPWKEEVSNFVIDPKSANQSIFVRALSREDAGTYSCVIVKHSHDIIRQIPLKIFDSGYSGMPVNTYTPPHTLPVTVGNNVKLYCEAFVGKIDLPDAQNKINWFKVGVNETRTILQNNSRTRVRKIVRDDGLTLGLYLLIENVESSDFGEYVCSVSNAADQITEVGTQLTDADEFFTSLSLCHLWSMVFYVTCISILLVTIICFIHHKYGYQIQLCMFQYVATDKNDDSKDYDVFILYEMKEINFVTGVLIPTLTNDYDYMLSSHALESDAAVNMECQARIAASKSVLLVLSCPYMNDVEQKKHFSQKLYTASNLHTKVICLMILENPNQLKNAEITKCAKWSALIEWPTFRKDSSKLWLSLRLNLPIKRKTFTKTDIRRYSTVNDRHIVCTL